MKEVERRRVGENENKSRGQEKWRGEDRHACRQAGRQAGRQIDR